MWGWQGAEPVDSLLIYDLAGGGLGIPGSFIAGSASRLSVALFD